MAASRPKILLVDDVDFILDVMREYLRRTPAEVLIARNGADALAITHRERPQLVYLDASLPDLGGLECCRQIKSDPYLRLIPVVLLFSAAAEMPHDAAALCGCDDALTKPLERKAFLNCGYRFLFDIERREKRVPCRLPVVCQIDGELQESVSGDLSLHGIYVQLRKPVLPGTLVTVTFTLPAGGPPIEGHGRVAWVNQGFQRYNLGLPQGIGVQFLHLNPTAQAQLAAFIGLHEELQQKRLDSGAAPAIYLGI